MPVGAWVPGGTNWPRCTGFAGSAKSHQTMPSVYQDENAWVPFAASVLCTESKPSSRDERLSGWKVPASSGVAGSLTSNR